MKTFSEFSEEIAAVNTGNAAMPPTAMFNKKKKYKVLTRNYIEILGKRKKQIK